MERAISSTSFDQANRIDNDKDESTSRLRRLQLDLEKKDVEKIANGARFWEWSMYFHWHQQYGQRIEGVKFKFMTYNVLAQELLQDNSYLYDHCNPDVLGWNYRGNNLIKEIKHHLPDVLCMQEVQNSHFEAFWNPKLKEIGYVGHYKKRNHDKCDGCAMFYKPGKLRLVKYVAVDYYRSGVYLMDRDNIGQVALFETVGDHPAASTFCVANTHLLYNPKRGDIKLIQLMQLLAEIDTVAHRAPQGYVPVIMCGDFNSTPLSPLYRLVTTGQLNYIGLTSHSISGQREFSGSTSGVFLTESMLSEKMDLSESCQYVSVRRKRQEMSVRCNELDVKTGTLHHHLPFISVYGHDVSEGRGSHEITSHHTRASHTLDYIFYTVLSKESAPLPSGKVVHGNVRDGKLHLMSRYRLMSDKETMSCGGLPNAYQPSDHLPLLAEFFIRH